MKIQTLQALRARVADKIPCAMVTALDGTAQTLVDGAGVSGDLTLTADELAEVRRRIALDRSGVLENTQLFARVYGPAPRMVIVGAVHIAQVLAPMARLAGFEVTVIDPRESFVRSGQLADISAIVAWPDEAMRQVAPDARTAVVTLTHDPKLDDPALATALRSPAFYIGALGSKKTHAKRLERLAGEGFGPEALSRIHGPVGLDINAVTPAEIAVSILAQVIAILRVEGRRQ
ncbi:MAG: xanthine dehydrogenase [Rhodospirillaceae bacterium]|nr:MAG: xanthine dehydrogenase [Rhodospirillaceae bacterium]